jgi:transposase InsO family protein
MNTAGREMVMQGFIAGPFRLTIGEQEYQVDMYVAPIQDDMLLGLDFLRRAEALINLPEEHLRLGESVIKEIGSAKETEVATVRVCKTTTIPPNSVAHIQCEIDKHLSAYYVEPLEQADIVIPRTVHDEDAQPVLCMVNLSDRHVKFKKQQVVASACEVVVVSPVPPDLSECFSVNQVSENESASSSQTCVLPAHLQELFERGKTHLNSDQQLKLKCLLIEFEDVFAQDEFDLGNFTAVEHSIDTGTAKPVKQRMRRTPMGFAEEEEAHLNKMLKANVIQPSSSEWASAPVLVRKKDGGVRWCVDYRALNSLTVKDVYPLPLVEDCMDMLAGNVWFSKLDANSAYWQIRIKPEDRKKTAFVTKYGLYEFVRMAFGLCNAPATYARAINVVLHGLNWNAVLAFLDDLMALGRSFEGHLKTLEDIFTRFRTYQLKLKPQKCDLFQPRVEFLGRWVGPDGIEVGSADIQTVLDWPRPTCTREVESFLGLTNYHRAFIKDYAKRASALYQITGKKQFAWGTEQEDAFMDLKQALTSPPILGLPNNRDPFVLDTDASDSAIGGVLSQVQQGVERVICYGSYSLSPEQKNYCTTRKELLAVVRFTRQFRHYLLGKPFQVRTDHSSLTWLLRFKEPQGQIARWLEELSQYDMKVIHRAGKDHGNADALSRMSAAPSECCPYYRSESDLEQLPCGGCKYCTKAHKSWRKFHETVDDVVTLSQKVCQINITSSEWEMFRDAGTLTDVTGDPVGPGQAQVVLLDSSSVVRQVTTVTDNNRVWDLPSDRVKEAQAAESSFEFLMHWLIDKHEPREGELFIASPSAKYYWVNRDSFTFIDGLVWRIDPKTNAHRLLIPEEIKAEVMYVCHDVPSAGHQGEERTLQRVKSRYFWHGMTRDVKRYVESCGSCNRCKKPNRKAKWEMTKYHAGAPLERVHLDFLGPLPKTPRGNEYVLMIVDQFTKWVECIALPSQTAEQTAQAVVDQFFSRFGCPFQIFTDRGTNFESKLFAAVCELLHIHKSRTTPYRPSANGQVERYNRTLMDAVRCFVGKNQSSWDILLPQIAGALRASVNRHTGFTPNRLMLGREVNTPADLVFPPSNIKEAADPEEYVERLERSIQSAHQEARKVLGQSVEVMKRDYDLKLYTRQYSVGDAVYILNSASVKGQSRKLSSPWKGPGVVEERITPYLYRIRMQKGSITTNHDRMKACRDAVTPTWVKKVQRELLRVVPSEGDDVVSDVLYCLCQGPDVGQFMIQCDNCDDWFHGPCVNITEEESSEMDEFICSRCDPPKGLQ